MATNGTVAAAAAAPPTGAMALLEKYSTLNSHIETARQSITEESAALEALQTTLGDLRSDRASLISDAAAAASERDGRLARHLRRALREYDDRAAARDAAQRDLDGAWREEEAARRGAGEGRLAFLERRREFRRACRQVRLVASAHRHEGRGGGDDAGEEYRFGSLQALLLLGGGKGGDDDDDENEYQDDGENEYQDGGNAAGKENGDGQQQGKKKRGRKQQQQQQPDEELLQAKAAHAEARRRQRTLSSALDQVRSDHREAVRRAEDRARRLGLQRAQLERVRADVERMERELHVLEREAREATEIGDGLARDAERRRKRVGGAGGGSAGGTEQRQQYSHSYRHHHHHHQQQQQQQRGSSFHRNFNLPEEVSEAVIDINHGGGGGGGLSSSRRITMTPYYATQQQQGGNDGSGGGGGGGGASRATAVSNPYSRNGQATGGSSQSLRQRQPAVNPYATSNGGNGNGSDNAPGRPMNSLQRQHPHRGGRIRADRRFTTALEIFSGGAEDDDVIDGPDRSAGLPPSASAVPSSASLRANSERVRKLLEDDSDDDDDILRPIW